MRRGLSLVGLIIGLTAGLAGVVGAHGVLVRSGPSANAVLPTAPEQVVLWFNEPVDPVFSGAAVFDADGHRVADRSAVSGDRQQIRVDTAALLRGAYTVRWRVLSAVDGHITSGSFAFAIGQALTAEAARPAAGSADPARAAFRWMGLLAALFLAGAAIFKAAVLPKADALSQATAEPQDGAGHGPGATARPLVPSVRLAALALVIGTIVEVALQAASLFDLPVGAVAADGRTLAFVLETRAGWGALARVGLAWVLAVLAAGNTQASAWISAVVGVGLLASFTWASHAAGVGIGAAAVDLGHLAAAAAWIGGLAALLLVHRAATPAGRRRLLAALVPRFSMVAAVSLGVVAVTGVINVWVLVPDIRSALDTAYGRTLAFKLLVAVLLAVLGALNRRRHGSFGPLATGEVGIAAAVVLAAAVLTITPPAGSAVARAPDARVLLSGIADDVGVRLTIAPALPGWNRLEAVLTRADGAPIEEPVQVMVRALKLDEDLDRRTVTLVHQEAGEYTGETGDLGAPGFWEIEVVVRRAGRRDTSTAFPLRLGEPPLCTPDPEAVRLLDQARAAWQAVRTWRETQQLTDGAGNVYLTWLEAEAPDRQRFRTSSGVEVVALGAVRYQKTGSGPWRRYEFSSPVPVEGPLYYMRDARGVIGGRAGRCGDEPCRVVLWMSPDGGAEFAAWIGLRTRLVHRLLMLEPTHFMTLRTSDINGPLRIAPPE